VIHAGAWRCVDVPFLQGLVRVGEVWLPQPQLARTEPKRSGERGEAASTGTAWQGCRRLLRAAVERVSTAA